MKRFRIRSRILLLILLMGTLTAGMTGCGDRNRKFDPAEVTAAVLPLMKESVLLNEIYWGAGILPDSGAEEKSGYKPASAADLAAKGFSDLNGLMEMTEAVFTEDYANLIYRTRFSGVSDGEGNMTYARYVQTYREENGVSVPENVMIRTDFTPELKGTVGYDWDSLRADRAEGEHVILTLNVTVWEGDSVGEGDSFPYALSVRALETGDGWRLDSPTYVSYSTSLAKYSGMKKS